MVSMSASTVSTSATRHAGSEASATAKDEVEARLLASIEVITKGLQSSASNTREMVGALRDFEARVDKLEQAIEPVHALTLKLTTAQKNISSSLTQFEKVHQHFRTADDVRGILQKSALIKSEAREDREEYFKALQRLCESYLFVEKHPEFMSTATYFQQIASLRQFATDSICIEFEVTLERQAASVEDYVGPHMDPDFNGQDALVMHEALPSEIGSRLRELAQCLTDCGLQDLFADAYARGRGRIVSDALDKLAESFWKETASLGFGNLGASAQTNRLQVTVRPPPVITKTQVEEPQAPQKNESQRLPTTAMRSSKSEFGRSFSKMTSHRQAVPGSSAQSMRDDGMSEFSTKSTKTSKSKKIKNFFLGRHRRKSKYKDGDSFTDGGTFSPQSSPSLPSPASFAPPDSGGSHDPLPPPPLLNPQSTAQLHQLMQQQDSFKSHGNLASFTSNDGFASHNTGAQNNKKYTRGEHGMIEVLDLAIEALEAELALSIRALPKGRAGRRLFLDAMVGPCERLAGLGMRDSLSYTHKTYSTSEAVFAVADVLEKLQDLHPKFYEILAPGSLAYLAEEEDEPGTPRRRSESMEKGFTSGPASRNSEHALPQEAWSQFVLLYKSWRNDAVQSLPQAYMYLLNPLSGIPESASVHPATTRVLTFARRLCEYRTVIQSLLVPEDGGGSDASLEFQAQQFQLNIEQLFDKYILMLFNLANAQRSTAPKVCLFLTNNVHFLVSGATRQQGYLGEIMENSHLLQDKQSDLDHAKEMYVTSVLAPVQQYLGATPLEQITQNSQNLSAADKKVVQNYCSAWQHWFDTVHKAQTKLEVPDFDLRTELRFRIRNAILEPYTKGYNWLNSIAYVQRKSVNNTFLPYSPEVLSTMISQFFEVSETSSDPRAVESFASR